MNRESRIEVAEGWHEHAVESWEDPILIVGATDSGKTTFARYLYRRLLASVDRVAFIDLDPGQNAFGLPTTAGMGLGTREGAGFPPEEGRRQLFTCGTSPVGHEARVLSALHTLTREARAQGAGRIVVDTSGFVDVAHGAAALKWAKVDLLRPCTVVAFQRGTELHPIIEPWRHCSDVTLIELPVSDQVRRRSREARRAYRTRCYRRYFAHARRIPLHFADVALYAPGPWARQQLIALEDADGYLLALAVIDAISEAVVWLTTPLSSSDEVAAIRMGDIKLDPTTFEDEHV